MRRGISPAEARYFFGHQSKWAIARKRRYEMRTKLFTIVVALASVFASQQAFAKSSTTTAAASKKHHHKKHAKKSSTATGTAARQNQ
jgi:hypothetical protein